MQQSSIKGSTQLLAVLGDPISHSLSPAMHNAAFTALGWDYAYLPCRVTATALPQALAGLVALNFKGFNLTIPHKESVLDLLDGVEEVARASGSVNTVANRSGKLYGTSTDGSGFINSLRAEHHFEVSGKRILLLGAGGTAAALSHSLILNGVAALTIANRTRSRAVALQERINSRHKLPLTVVDLAELERLDWSSFDLLVNTTAVGLERDESPVAEGLLHPGLLVYDAVYQKGGTKLLNQAQAVGCPVVSGLALLLYQGVESFRYWFEEDPPLDLMRQALRRAAGEA